MRTRQSFEAGQGESLTDALLSSTESGLQNWTAPRHKDSNDTPADDDAEERPSWRDKQVQ